MRLKLMNNPDSKDEPGAHAAFAGASGSAETCDKCDYWNLRGVATPPTTVYGYCDLFHKLTKSKHGTECTGWTPRNPPNNLVSQPRNKASACGDGSQPGSA